jgi:hypothetical protein
MRRAVLSLAAFCCLLPAPAGAGGTGVSLTLVTVPPTCRGLTDACTNDPLRACASADDCMVGGVDPRSKLSYSGKKGIAKASIRGVHDASGLPVSTDGTPGTDDDYILLVNVTDCDYADVTDCNDVARLRHALAFKVELRDGKAKLNVDLGAMLEAFFPAGRALRMRGAELRLPPTNPASCPGDNTAAGVASRSFEGCQSGALLAFTGILVGE